MTQMPPVEDIDSFLSSLDFSDLSPTSYVQSYADEYSERPYETAVTFARFLLAAEGRREGACLDIGCGLGLFALVLKWAGARSVLAVDWDPSFVAAARRLAARASLEVTFEEAAADDAMAAGRGDVDAAFSYSFIEHVYDLDGHFRRVHGVLTDDGIYVAGTGISGLHPPTLLRYGHGHLSHERGSRDASSRRPGFRRRRLALIREAYPDMDPERAEWLARKTRGWAGQDLLRVVATAEGGRVQRRLPWWNLNSCDPRNGNWPDRLMSPRTARAAMRRAGFRAALVRPAQTPPARSSPSVAARLRAGAGRYLPGPLPFVLATGFTLVGRKDQTPAT